MGELPEMWACRGTDAEEPDLSQCSAAKIPTFGLRSQRAGCRSTGGAFAARKSPATMKLRGSFDRSTAGEDDGIRTRNHRIDSPEL